MGLGRLLTGMAFLIFAISLLPGMFGGRLGDLDAYVPRRQRSPAALGGSAPAESALVWMKNQYREALDRARREGKLVLRQLHRLRLHQLPLDEGQHVHPARDRRRHEELRPGGTLHRRHRRRLRREPEAGARQVQDRGRALLRHPRSGREGDRDLPRPHQRSRRSSWRSCRRAAPRRRRRRPSATGSLPGGQATGRRSRSTPPRWPAKSSWSTSGPPGACPAFRRSPASTNCTSEYRRQRASRYSAFPWTKKAPTRVEPFLQEAPDGVPGGSGQRAPERAVQDWTNSP